MTIDEYLAHKGCLNGSRLIDSRQHMFLVSDGIDTYLVVVARHKALNGVAFIGTEDVTDAELIVEDDLQAIQGISCLLGQ